MKTSILLILLFSLGFLPSSFQNKIEETYSLTIEVDDLRNSTGQVQYALYNVDGTIPDEHYKNYYKIANEKIINGTSSLTFDNLPAGIYAVNILHDEDINGKIKKGFVLPKEGIGFSNFESIGILNRPSFQKASFQLDKDLKIKVRIIYL